MSLYTSSSLFPPMPWSVAQGKQGYDFTHSTLGFFE